LVTFRSGDHSGQILAGWISADGTAGSKLGSIRAPGALVGTPSVATGQADALIAFASRGSKGSPWQIAIARARGGQAPELATSVFGAADADDPARIAPAPAALPRGHWLLQWTEQSTSGHKVRVQVLDPDQNPLDEPVDVSPEAANAGQGGLWVVGSKAISAFVVSRTGAQELWGAFLSCE
jgi:hypothetical protein